MAIRDDLMPWILEALKANGGSATVLTVCKHIWAHHEPELRRAGDLFYSWQYDVRWRATKLRKNHKLRANKPSEPWRLA